MKFKSETKTNEYGRPVSSFPSMAEYSMAKKEMEINIDLGSEEGDKTAVALIDRDTLALIYWYIISKNEKRKVKIGDKHGTKMDNNIQSR
ncbi:unnamed protein product, partial [marine sediment metagenome]